MAVFIEGYQRQQLWRRSIWPHHNRKSLADDQVRWQKLLADTRDLFAVRRNGPRERSMADTVLSGEIRHTLMAWPHRSVNVIILETATDSCQNASCTTCPTRFATGMLPLATRLRLLLPTNPTRSPSQPQPPIRDIWEARSCHQEDWG